MSESMPSPLLELGVSQVMESRKARHEAWFQAPSSFESVSMAPGTEKRNASIFNWRSAKPFWRVSHFSFFCGLNPTRQARPRLVREGEGELFWRTRPQSNIQTSPRLGVMFFAFQ